MVSRSRPRSKPQDSKPRLSKTQLSKTQDAKPEHSKPDWKPLVAVQTCFVVEDVGAAVDVCEKDFGWGPFLQFSAPSPGVDADREGLTHVALGNAGATQIELIATEGVRNTVAEYQDRYARGFQHLGVVCPDIDAAGAELPSLGGRVREAGSYPGLRFAFVDAPTGPGMLELLQTDGNQPTPKTSRKRTDEVLRVTSASIVARDIEPALAFFAAAFGWSDAAIIEDALECDGREVGRAKRAWGSSGTLRLELIEPGPGDNPYADHLAARDHGLVHAGAAPRGAGHVGDERAGDGRAGDGHVGDGRATSAGPQWRWAATDERFGFCATPFGKPGLRVDVASGA